MNESADSEPAKDRGWVSGVASWFFRNAKIAAAFCGGIGTATVLVFNAGRDYQDVKTQLEVNRVEIQVLRAELRELESALIRPHN